MLTLLLLLLLAAAAQGLPNMTCLCAGGTHSCLLSVSLEVVCWGSPIFGRLGYGTAMQYLSPSAALAANPGGVQLTQMGSNPAKVIRCGYDFTAVLLASGDVVAFGRNDFGQLGRGHLQNVGDNELPWQVPGGPVTLPGPARAFCVGGWHCCAVMDSPDLGKVACWGRSDNGRLGYGNTANIGDDESVVVAGFVAVGGTGTAVAVFCGGHHTLALMSDGALRAWGYNAHSQLGLSGSDVGDDESPATQPNIALGLGGGTPVLWVSGGRYHTCVTSALGAKCFGYGANGRLGTGATSSVSDPSAIGFIDFGVGKVVLQLEAFWEHTCGVLAWGGVVKCFGISLFGQLGCGWSCPDRLAPNETVALSGPVSALGVGPIAQHTFALHPGGQFQAWGHAFQGKLGYGDSEIVGDDETPASVGNVAYHEGLVCATALPETHTRTQVSHTAPSETQTRATRTATIATKTGTRASRTATAVSKTKTQHSHTATLQTASLASLTQTGITRTPRSRLATRASSTALASLTAGLPSTRTTSSAATSSSEESRSQTGITRTPRSRPDTLTATHTRHASSTAEPVPATSSSSAAADGGVVVTLVLVGMGAVVLLVVLGLVALGVFLMLQRRRRHTDDDEVVEMSPSSSSAQRSGLEYANASSVVDVPDDGLEYANVGGVADAASEYANVPTH